MLSNNWALANEYIKSHSRKVADVMTRDVITAKPDTPLGDVAAILERNRIKRVPIVEGGKLVGIISRANILQALASATKNSPLLRPPMTPSCVKRYSLGWLQSRGARPCSPSLFRTAPSICGDLSTRSRRRKQLDWQQNSRPVSARSLITSSFNLSAQAGRELTKLP